MGDLELDAWAENFRTELAARFAALGFTLGEADGFDTLFNDWHAAYLAHAAAQDAARQATQAKVALAASLRSLARQHARRLQAHPAMTHEVRAAFRITVPDATRTPVAVPVTRPVASVDTSQRFRHVLKVADETAPTRVARPAGVAGVQVWVKLGGTLPVAMNEVSFKAVSGRPGRVVCEYQIADGGTTAHYLLRWVNPRGEAGPWSQTISRDDRRIAAAAGAPVEIGGGLS